MSGAYPYFGPTGQLDSIDHYRIDEPFALIGEDGDHFLKFRDRPMTIYFEGKANVNNHAHIIGDSDECLAKWFYYFFMFRDVTPVLSRQGVGRYKLTKAGLEQLQVTLPSKTEQAAIVEVLSTWDQAIAATERLLANSRSQWHALIGITLHLPSANPADTASADNGGFPPSVQPGIPNLPPAPAGWRRIHLRDHLNEVRRPVALVDDQPYTLVTVKRSRGGVALREILPGKDVKTPTQFHVRTGDFLISKRQIVHGACGIVPAALDGAVVSNEYAVLHSDGQIDLQFLRYLSESRYFQQTCFHSSIGVHVEKMIFKTERWLAWPFNIPPLAQQQRIVQMLDTASQEVKAISAQLEVLRREKAALMAQLLTGKRRVKLPEVEEEAQT